MSQARGQEFATPTGMRVSIGSFSFLIAFLMSFMTAGELSWAKTTAPYPGYVSDVEGEKSERYVEVYLYAPQLQKEKTLHEMIFSPLTKEFRSRYEEKFGKLDPDSILYQNSFRESKDNRGNSAELERLNLERRTFAEYMTRRLTEYHFDNYMNTKPELRPIMEVKEKIQNVKVEVSKDTRLNIQYNFAANIIDLVLDNPYCDSKLALEMDPKAFGPGKMNESRLMLAKKLTTTINTRLHVTNTEGTVYSDISKAIPKYYMSTYLGARAAYKAGGTLPRETLYLIGFTHSY